MLEILAELFVDQAGDHPLDLGVAELGLGLPFELRLADLHADDRGETLAGVVALEVHVLAFEEVVLGRVVVQRAGQAPT